MFSTPSIINLYTKFGKTDFDVFSVKLLLPSIYYGKYDDGIESEGKELVFNCSTRFSVAKSKTISGICFTILGLGISVTKQNGY